MSSLSRTNAATGLGVGKPLALLIACSALLGACSDIYYDRRETVALGANDFNASNIAVMGVDPWPRYVGNKNLAFNGERMQAAVERYRKHEVIRPISPTTTLTSQAPPPLTTEAIALPQSSTTAAPAVPVK